MYEVGSDKLLMVASDRVSAFDVVLPQPIPRKGEVLTQITAWWLSQLEATVDHHIIAVDADEIERRVPELAGTRSQWAGRSILVHRTKPLPVECVVRGYISGSAWKEYSAAGTLAGEALQEGLSESQQLPEPIFSPSTKAEEGHDENITFAQVKEILGNDLARQLRDLSLEIYSRGRDAVGERGIILADTKFEFGMGAAGQVVLIDEVLTPDSSRFWPKEHYQIGRGQPSLDKQPIRDYLAGLSDWNKQPPPPDLPQEVIAETTNRYLDIFQRVTGVHLNDFVPSVFPSEG
jgi:phosphoribosylaminoimidazole-succinocarboxamide synthase